MQEVGGSNPLAPTNSQNIVVSRQKWQKDGVFMSHVVATKQRWSLASYVLRDAWTDFILSRQATRATPATLDFYRFTAGMFLSWVEGQGITEPSQVDARLVRQYIAELASKGKADKTLHAHARAIRTMLRFWYAEGYIQELPKFAMPKLDKKKLPVLDAEQLQAVLKHCNKREKALVLFLADTGLRREEACALNWEDVDFSSGLILVRRGKGGKARSAVAGASSRRALLAYRRAQEEHGDNTPVFRNVDGSRLTGNALRLICRRLTERTGIKMTPHALRRTFATLSLREGMNPLHLQALLGHASLEMVQTYAQMVDDDLLQAHQAHSPIDNLSHLR